MPEELAGLFGAQEGGVGLNRDVLEAGVLGFGKGGKVIVKVGESVVNLRVGFGKFGLRGGD